VYQNGKNRPAIAADGAGSAAQPVRILGNAVVGSGAAGIGLSGSAVGIVVENRVCDTTGPGVSVNHATVLSLERNEVTGAKTAGFAIVDRAVVWEMTDNAADANTGPRFILRDSAIKGTPHPKVGKP
jgi:hypothetical protein